MKHIVKNVDHSGEWIDGKIPIKNDEVQTITLRELSKYIETLPDNILDKPLIWENEEGCLGGYDNVEEVFDLDSINDGHIII